jgi:hypothetical protein
LALPRASASSSASSSSTGSSSTGSAHAGGPFQLPPGAARLHEATATEAGRRAIMKQALTCYMAVQAAFRGSDLSGGRGPGTASSSASGPGRGAPALARGCGRPPAAAPAPPEPALVEAAALEVLRDLVGEVEAAAAGAGAGAGAPPRSSLWSPQRLALLQKHLARAGL